MVIFTSDVYGVSWTLRNHQSSATQMLSGHLKRSPHNYSTCHIFQCNCSSFFKAEKDAKRGRRGKSNLTNNTEEWET